MGVSGTNCALWAGPKGHILQYWYHCPPLNCVLTCYLISRHISLSSSIRGNRQTPWDISQLSRMYTWFSFYLHLCQRIETHSLHGSPADCLESLMKRGNLNTMVCQHWLREMPPRAQKVLDKQTRLNRHYKKMMTGHVNIAGRRPNKQTGT